jgi:hypothetical protein
MYVNKVTVTQNSYLAFRFIAMCRIEHRNVECVDLSHKYAQSFVWKIFCVFTVTQLQVLI